jgi:hypothetical protein
MDPSKQRVSNELAVTQPGEKLVCSIKRHPIGIVTMHFISALMLAVVAILIFGVGPHLSTSITPTQINQIGAVALLVLGVLAVVYNLIASKVYWGNSWVITTDSVTQVEQDSLFSRQSSQLSLGNLEDVSAEQNGILAHMFNYGLLKVETAGERSKFVFPYCPNPNYYAQQILMARENFEQGHVAQDHGVNINTLAPPQQSQPPQQPSQSPRA